MKTDVDYLCDRCKHVDTCECAYDEYNRVINDDWIVDNLDLYLHHMYKIELERYNQLHPYTPSLLRCLLYRLGVVDKVW